MLAVTGGKLPQGIYIYIYIAIKLLTNMNIASQNHL